MLSCRPPPPRNDNLERSRDDPQRILAWDETDAQDEDEFSLEDMAGGEGIGADDELDDFEFESDLDDVSPTPGRLQPLNDWERQEFNSYLALAKDRIGGVPRLYVEQNTFFFNTSTIHSTLSKCVYPTPELLYARLRRWFLWDPAVYGDVPCPLCKNTLIGHGNIPSPRRIIDIDSTIMAIGYRYRCTHCKNAKSGLKTVTFQSWDPRILAVLPPLLAAEFPAILSRRNGITRTLFRNMRAAFLGGMGAKQFADGVRSQHLERYDEAHLQYLQYLASREQLDKFCGLKHRRISTFADFEGFHGTVPSAAWFKTLYDRFIAQHRNEILKHTSMLTLTIGALDHSHKAC
jgi:hypothetical protein